MMNTSVIKQTYLAPSCRWREIFQEEYFLLSNLPPASGGIEGTEEEDMN